MREAFALGTKFKQAPKDAVMKVHDLLIITFFKIKINAKKIHDEQKVKIFPPPNPGPVSNKTLVTKISSWL